MALSWFTHLLHSSQLPLIKPPKTLPKSTSSHAGMYIFFYLCSSSKFLAPELWHAANSVLKGPTNIRGSKLQNFSANVIWNSRKFFFCTVESLNWPCESDSASKPTTIYLSAFVHPCCEHANNHHNHDFELLKKFVSSSCSVPCLIFIIILLLPPPPSIFSPNSRGQHCLTCNFQTSPRTQPIDYTAYFVRNFIMYGSVGRSVGRSVLAVRRRSFLQDFWGLRPCERPWRGCRWKVDVAQRGMG